MENLIHKEYNTTQSLSRKEKKPLKWGGIIYLYSIMNSTLGYEPRSLGSIPNRGNKIY